MIQLGFEILFSYVIDSKIVAKIEDITVSKHELCEDVMTHQDQLLWYAIHSGDRSNGNFIFIFILPIFKE